MSEPTVNKQAEPNKPQPICLDLCRVELSNLRRQAHKAYRKRPRPFGMDWPWMIVLFAYLALMPRSTVWQTLLGLSMWEATAANIGLLMLVALVYRSFTMGRRERFVRKYLHDHGVPICRSCGYDLRGLTESRCPECGHPFDPSLFSGHNELDP